MEIINNINCKHATNASQMRHKHTTNTPQIHHTHATNTTLQFQLRLYICVNHIIMLSCYAVSCQFETLTAFDVMITTVYCMVAFNLLRNITHSPSTERNQK